MKTLQEGQPQNADQVEEGEAEIVEDQNKVSLNQQFYTWLCNVF